jgi:hypothetical protein
MPEKNLFIRLLEEAEKFCSHFGVGTQTIIETLEEKTDWAFIIKVDALHETACRDLVSRVLALKDGTQPEELSSFISDMSFQGRSSVLKVVEASGCPKDLMRFLEGVRQIRNAFAHDIRSVSMSLLEVIEQRKNRTQLLTSSST